MKGFRSVERLNAKIRADLRGTEFFTAGKFFIIGKVLDVADNGGNLYIELGDDKKQSSTITVVLFENDRKYIGDKEALLEVGEIRRLVTKANFFQKRGKLQLALKDIDPTFSRQAELDVDAILAELKSEGVTKNNRPIPLLPTRIGLITSGASSAENDFFGCCHYTWFLV